MNEWWSWFDNPPLKAGYYLVGAPGLVGYARYLPKKKTWVFPSAQMAFHVTHYKCLPEPPKKEQP